MQVILLENIKNLGKIGDVVNVKRGFARNYLLKYEKALNASKENIKIVNNKKEQLNKKDLEFKKEARQKFDILDKKKYVVKKLVTENNELYGSVKPKEISKLIKEIDKIDINPSQIDLEKEIKSTGVFKTTINLHSEIQAKILIEVEKSEEKKS
tara:strand:+ start:295 stop:756 length:462 start_codon:yes stop_codon:yes gene_type:complete